MPNYRRLYVPGGTYFFTVVTQGRAPILTSELARPLLRDSILRCRESRPFESLGWVLLPDHLHTMWTLPPGDDDFSSRWASIKARFSAAWVSAGGVEQFVTRSRAKHRGRGVW